MKNKVNFSFPLIFFILSNFCLATPAFSETIIQCLGKEEQIIHEGQYNGPLYSLNQKLLNNFVYNSNLKIKSQYINKICNDDNFSPSVNLLYFLMVEGKQIFLIQEKDIASKFQKVQLVENFLVDIPTFFFQYLADIQSVLPTPHCLKENLPIVDKLLFEYQYVESEAQWNNQLLGKDKLHSIFEALKNLDGLIKKCKVKASTRKKTT